MAISSIHIEAGASGYFAHNSRETKTNNSIFNDEENYCSASKEEAFKMFREELRIRTQAYENRTGQKMQRNATTHLSAIFNFNYQTTPQQAHKVCEYLEKTLDTKVVQMSMHRDEGHIIEEESKALHDKIKVNTAIKNYHGHIEMLGLDSQGNSIRRKLDKPMLREIQTEVAKILQMERGRQTSYNKEEYLKITNELKPKNEYADKTSYNKAFNEKAKELGLLKERKAKRLDTYEFKKAKEMEATKVKEKEKEILATKEQLKTANNQLREFMKSNNANRTDYAELEKEKKVLEEKLKTKELTEKELLEKFQKLEETFKTTLAQKDKFLGNLQEIGKEISKETPIKTISEIPEAVKTILEQNKSLEAQKEDLSNKVTTLEEKIVLNTNMSDYDVQKELQNIINDEIEVKNVKTGVFSTEEAPVIKNSKSFLQKIQDLATQGTAKVKQELQSWKNKYNDLLEVLKSKDKEIDSLKEKVRELSTKQQKEYMNIVSDLQSEAKRDGLDTRQERSSILDNKIEIFKKIQEQENTKKRENSKSR